jgi:hypothetical protein
MMWIEERLPCPRCGHKRFVRPAKFVSVCFQCRTTWSSTTRSEIRRVDALAQFQPHERARLIAYRGAVRCGLYTDWPCAEPGETQTAGPSQSARDLRSDAAPSILHADASVRIEP